MVDMVSVKRRVRLSLASGDSELLESRVAPTAPPRGIA